MHRKINKIHPNGRIKFSLVNYIRNKNPFAPPVRTIACEILMQTSIVSITLHFREYFHLAHNLQSVKFLLFILGLYFYFLFVISTGDSSTVINYIKAPTSYTIIHMHIYIYCTFI